MPAAIRLFVFGTLKKGFPLHQRGLAGAIYHGRFRTRRPYPMLCGHSIRLERHEMIFSTAG